MPALFVPFVTSVSRLKTVRASTWFGKAHVQTAIQKNTEALKIADGRRNVEWHFGKDLEGSGSSTIPKFAVRG
jgi:hypothetical protein